VVASFLGSTRSIRAGQAIWRSVVVLRRHRPVAGLTILLSVLGLAAAMATPAAAASASAAGWRVVFSRSAPPPEQLEYATVIAPAPDDAWALGGTVPAGGSGRPIAARWNGHRWRTAAMPDVPGFISAAYATSPSSIWAVTGETGYLLHWNGTKWSIVHRFPEPKAGEYPAQLTGVSAFSAGDVWVFGGVDGYTNLVGEGTWHYNGKRWIQVRKGTAINIVQASPLSPRDIWAVGIPNAIGYNALLRYNGRSWRPARIPVGDEIETVLALSDRDVWAVGRNVNLSPGPAVVLHWNGKHWRSLQTDVAGAAIMRYVTSDGRGGVWMTAQALPSGTTYRIHRSASGAYTRTALPDGQYIDSLALRPRTRTVWATGQYFSEPHTTAQIWASSPTG
jgi:hypothetical protein